MLIFLVFFLSQNHTSVEWKGKEKLAFYSSFREYQCKGISVERFKYLLKSIFICIASIWKSRKKNFISHLSSIVCLHRAWWDNVVFWLCSFSYYFFWGRKNTHTELFDVHKSEKGWWVYSRQTTTTTIFGLIKIIFLFFLLLSSLSISPSFQRKHFRLSTDDFYHFFFISFFSPLHLFASLLFLHMMCRDYRHLSHRLLSMFVEHQVKKKRKIEN